MDILTGPGLIDAIAEVINREDLNSTIPAWIQMAEAKMNQTLRVREMVKRSVTTATASYIPLPDDFVAMKSVRINHANGPVRLFLSSEDSINDPRQRGTWSEHPKYFTIVGNEIELSPFKPGQTFEVEMTYFSTIPKLDLTTAGATNWLQQRSPDFYLYGALAHSAQYLGEDERLPVWAEIVKNILTDLNLDYETSRTAGSTLREVRKSIG